MAVDSAEDFSPKPTAHDVFPGCSLDRRTFLQGTAASGAAIAFGGAASSTAAADEDDPTAASYYDQQPEFQRPIGDLAGWAFGSVFGDTNEDPNPDRIALYSQCNSAKEWWDSIYTTKLDNRLTDLQMAAHVEGRSRIADAWEDGENTSEAYNYVYDGVEDIYSVPYGNTIETAATVWAEVAYASRVARESEDVPDRFVATTIPNDQYSAHEDHDDGDEDTDIIEDETYIDPDTVETSIELPNGEDFETTVPMIHQEWDNDDGLTYYLTDELLDAYDPEEELFVEFPTREGNEVDIRGDIMTMAGDDSGDDDPEDTDMPAQSIMVLAELGEILHEIEEEMDEVKANYDMGLVEDIYDLLDEGEIEPSDVRGVAGMAEYLSGSTDATESRYQMALMNQLGLGRADLADVSSMTLEYTGYTGKEIDRDDNGDIESVQLVDDVDGLEVEGQLFADLVIDDGFAAEKTYLASDPHVAYRESGNIVIHNYHSDETIDEISVTGSNHSFNPDLTKAATHDGERMHLYDLQTGERLWREWSDEYTQDTAIDPRGEYAVSIHQSADNSFYVYDMEDGEELHSADPQGDNTGAHWSLDGEYLALDGRDPTDDPSVVLDRSWDEVWTPDDTEPLHLSNYSGQVIHESEDGDEITLIDLEDGTEEWTAEHDGSHATFSPNDELIACRGDTETVALLNADDGSTEWETDPLGDSASSIDFLGKFVFVTAGEHCYAIKDGEVIEEFDVDTGSDPTIYSDWDEDETRYDGQITNAIAFDASNGDDHQLYHGELEVLELTDRDGNVLDDDWEGDWDRPEHDTVDTSDYREELERISETHAEAVASREDDDGSTSVDIGFDNPLDDFGDGAVWVGLAVIVLAIVTIVSIVTDFIPILNN